MSAVTERSDHAQNSLDHALAYIRLGWCLCSIPPGTKGPSDSGWNAPAQVIDTEDRARKVFAQRPEWGWGLVHGPSGTCAIDIDHLAYSRHALAELGIDLDAEIKGAPQIIGRQGRGKAIFRMPEGTFAPHKLVWPASGADKPITVLELRCGSVQDVLPPTIHPDTKNAYQWADGIPTEVPVLPAILVSLWTNWAAVMPQLRASCPWAKPEERIAPPRSRPRTPNDSNSPSVIDEFNRANDVRSMLEANGYKSRGKRMLAPTSSSGLAGVVIMDEGRCYSHHASDPLNDGHAHDAFDLYVMFDHGGNFNQAVRSAAEQLGVNKSASSPAFDVASFIASTQKMQANMRADGRDKARAHHTPGGAEPVGALLRPVSVFDVQSNPAPPPAFAWDHYLPCGVVSLLGAHGGVGKSTVALMLSVGAALGSPLFGICTQQTNALYVSLEDGTDTVRHRLRHICEVWGINPADLVGRLHIVDGTDSPELFSADNRGAGDTTKTYRELCALVKSTNAGLVVVDNASDAFGADEINRKQVRAFMRALTQVARLTNCAALLLAHVAKTTSRAATPDNGEGYSGSTAWHNSARSRLFLSRASSGLLILEHQKSNFGKMCEPLKLEWLSDGLPQVVTQSAGSNTLVDNYIASKLLAMIAEFESRGQFCHTANNSPRAIYAMLKPELQFKALNISKEETKRLVTHCHREKLIERLEYQTLDRKTHERWTLTDEGRLRAV